MTSRQNQSKKLRVIIFVNILVTIAQVVGGIMANSLSIITDALHNLGDVSAIILSYIAIKFLVKKYSKDKTFGYKRSEIVATFLNSILLIAIALNIIYMAVTRFGKGIEIDATLVIIMATLGILANGGSALLLMSESKNSLNIRSSYIHLVADMLDSLAVVIGGVFIYFWNLTWIDTILSIVIGVYLIIISVKLVLSSLSVMMQFAPKDVDVLEIEKEVLKHSEITNIHHIHLWQLNDNERYLEAHIDFKEDLSLSKVSKIIKDLSDEIGSKFNLCHVLLAPEIGINDSKKLIITD